jgi:hypothetical protein
LRAGSADGRRNGISRVFSGWTVKEPDEGDIAQARERVKNLVTQVRKAKEGGAKALADEAKVLRGDAGEIQRHITDYSNHYHRDRGDTGDARNVPG